MSIVISFFNGEPYLEEAIQSVFAQAYQDWELLLIDDGSTDASSETARRAVARFPSRVSIATHPAQANHGLSASRNLGIERAKGEYIAFLDADDVWLADKLELQVSALDLHPDVGMIYAAAEYWYGWTGDPADAGRDFVPDLRVTAGEEHPPPKLLPLFLRDGSITPCTCSLLVRRELARRIGGFNPDFRSLYEDQVFYAKVCLTAPILRLEECVARYRRHSHSMCASPPLNPAVARRRYLDWLHAYLLQTGAGDSAVWQALRAEYRKLPLPSRSLSSAVRDIASRCVRLVRAI